MKAFKLEGTSMLPLFKSGEVVLVRPFSLSPGDCVVYDFKGRRLLHRVLKTSPEGAWFSDDAGRLAPHFAPRERIEGKVVSNNPLKSGRAGLAYSKLRRFFTKLNG